MVERIVKKVIFSVILNASGKFLLISLESLWITDTFCGFCPSPNTNFCGVVYNYILSIYTLVMLPYFTKQMECLRYTYNYYFTNLNDRDEVHYKKNEDSNNNSNIISEKMIFISSVSFCDSPMFQM